MKHKGSWRNSKYITAVVLLLALLELGLVLFGNQLQMNSSRRLQSAYDEQLSYEKMAARLKESADYLTNEVRLYAVTGDPAHFRNYWNEAEVDQHREEVIQELEDLPLPNGEKWDLERAKYFSDILMHIEISAMRLKLESTSEDPANVFGPEVLTEGGDGSSAGEERQKDAADFQAWIQYVLSYPLEPDYDCAQPEKDRRSIEILYGSPYLTYKKLIDSYIERFQSTMSQRLQQSVTAARQEADRAYLLQTACGIGEMGILLLLILLFQAWYIRPVVRYKKLIERQHGRRRMFVEPEGVWELQQFAEEFNALSSDMLAELAKSESIEKELIEAKGRAEKASQVKSQFLTQMSHELRTPLNTISGYLYLLKDTRLSGAQRRYAENMQLAADILLEEINEILDYAKLEAGRMTFEDKNFNLRAILTDLQAMLENEAEQRGLKLLQDIPETLPEYLYGDPLRLKQVLTNLLYNAFKFTKEGSVTLGIRILMEGERKCVLEFSVEDTGIGIPRDRQQSIFQPFTQGDGSITRKYGGTGLGLPICRKMVEEMSHGQYTLLLESEAGVGSRFFFDMEFVYGRPESRERKHRPGRQQARRQLSILIVDDNEINLVLESELLHKFGYTADTESNPEKVVQRVQEKPYDIIFLDISMPVLSGYDLAQLLRQLPGGEGLVLIALTANIGSEVEEKLQAAGMNDYLTKPIPIPRLQELLEKYTEEAAAYQGTLPAADSGDEDIALGQLEAQLGGDRQAVRELFDIFLEDNVGFRERLEQAREKGDRKTMEEELHRLKGVSGNLLCRRLESAAAQNLAALREGKTMDLESLYAALDAVLKKMRNDT